MCCPELDIYDSNRTIEKEYIIFGAGYEGYKSKKILEATNRKIIAWCDNNQLLWKSKIEDIEVISPGELVNNFRNATVIISVKEWVLQIYQQLIKMGFTRENILIPKKGFLMGVSGKQYFDMFEPDSCECGGGRYLLMLAVGMELHQKSLFHGVWENMKKFMHLNQTHRVG